MSSCLRTGFGVYGSGGDGVVKERGLRVCSVAAVETLQLKKESSSSSSSSSSSCVRNDFKSSFVLTADQNSISPFSRGQQQQQQQQPFYLSKSMKWWEKSLQPNMIEIQSAQHLVDSLLTFGDRLVVIDFYSPGCGGCKSLHPKICQLAEFNPSTIFLKVNHEIHKAMCYALHVHVLPFFRFYKGPNGKVCSFSCTNATVKKFKDALAKHSPETGVFGPAKGLEDSELAALASIGLLPSDDHEQMGINLVDSFAIA